MNRTELAAEWALLQNQQDSYEKCSLAIKLFTILLSLFAAALNIDFALALGFVLICWGQDAIWKTFQARIEQRLLPLESALEHEKEHVSAYQYNRQHLDNRPSSIGLIKEYASQSLRPTVAYPYVLLLCLLGANVLYH